MCKKIFFISVLFSLFNSTSVFAFDHPDGCPVSRAEKIVCAAVMCEFGAAMGENPSECNQVRIDLAVYLASLGFWDKPAKCMNRDSDCNTKGKAKKAPANARHCTDPDTGIVDSNCMRGMNIMTMDCSEEPAGEKQDSCYRELSVRNNMCTNAINGTLEPCADNTVTAYEPPNTYMTLEEKYKDDPTVRVYPQGVFNMSLVPPGSFYYWTRDVDGGLKMMVFLRSEKTDHCMSMPPKDMLECLGGSTRMFANDWPEECKTTDNFKDCMTRHGLL